MHPPADVMAARAPFRIRHPKLVPRYAGRMRGIACTRIGRERLREALAEMPSRPCCLEVDDTELDCEVLMVEVLNTRFAGPAPDRSPVRIWRPAIRRDVLTAGKPSRKCSTGWSDLIAETRL